jgi:hypothetical protein
MNRAEEGLGQDRQTAEIPVHAATDATIYHNVFYAPMACRVQSVRLMADAALTGASDMVYSAYLYLFHLRAGAVVGGVPLATRAYVTGTDEAAMVATAFYTAAAPGKSLAAGDGLAIQRLLVGAGGLATPRFAVTTLYDRAG